MIISLGRFRGRQKVELHKALRIELHFVEGLHVRIGSAARDPPTHCCQGYFFAMRNVAYRGQPKSVCQVRVVWATRSAEISI